MKISLLSFFAIAAASVIPSGVAAQNLAASDDAPNVVEVRGDTLFLVSGTTYRYTVDTPVDEGLVCTGATVVDIGRQLRLTGGGEIASYAVIDRYRQSKTRGRLSAGDVLTVETASGKESYKVVVSEGALAATLAARSDRVTAGKSGDVTLDFIAGQRTGNATVVFEIPAGVAVSYDNTTVDVIGRGEVSLRDLPRQSIGRHGTNYSYDRVGEVEVAGSEGGGRTVTFTGLDLRPFNGVDVRLKIKDAKLDAGTYAFTARYSTSEPSVYHSAVTASSTAVVEAGAETKSADSPDPYAVMHDVGNFGAKGDGITDDTEAVNRAIEELHRAGGGILNFGAGRWMVRTVRLKSNVWLHVERDAVVACLPGCDDPETTWFSDRAYRSGLSPTDPAPYSEPENWLTKQDVGHTFFRNAMFFAEREENIRIFGNGRITGNGVLQTGDRVMNNPPDRRADKMFVFKLCRDVEIGGYGTELDMWYDPESDRPYYITARGRDYELENVLHIDRGGHFVLLATGTDGIDVHDTCFGLHDSGNSRDIYDFMGCSDVTVTNIYSKVSSDDIVKLGSDCSLGFTRPAARYMVRNVIGDTNCNLFQIGSETADDISDVWVDNIYVLGSNKAGFSISTNDGATVRNIFLNSGRTGKLHSRSVMHRTRAPFFISVSNRGRTLGADVRRFRFTENGRVRDELLVTNAPIGSVENVVLRDVDIRDVYGGSSFRGDRWKPYDGTQNRATPIIAGYKLPEEEDVEGGLGFTLPDGRHTGYVAGIEFHGIDLTVEGGNPTEDSAASPPEIGVGRYNVGDLAVQPSYGFWFRHARDVVVKNCKVVCTRPDGRHAIVLDDVHGARIERVDLPGTGARPLVKELNSQGILLKQ